MSDEQLAESIRDALLADDPGAVPVRLRARMAMIPDEVGGATVRTTWPQRLRAFVVPATVLTVAVVAFISGGLVQRAAPTGTALPSAAQSSPTPSGSGASAPASPSAAVAPSAPVTPESSGPIVLDPSKVTGVMEGTFAVRGSLAFRLGYADTVGWPGLSVMDLLDSRNGFGLASLQNGHDIAAVAVGGNGVVWMETWYTMPPIDCGGRTGCGIHQGQPVSWALNVTDLDGKTTRLDHGVVTRTSVGCEGCGPRPPAMAADDGRVAYAVPRPNAPGAPDASTIIVRWLPGGEVARQVDTRGYVAQLGVWNQALFYREAIGQGGEGSVDPADATLYLATSDSAEPRPLEDHVAQATIGDGGLPAADRIAWVSNAPDAVGIRIAPIAAVAPTLVEPAESLTSVDGSQPSATSPTLIGDGVAWIVQGPDWTGGWVSQVFAWHPFWATGLSVPMLGSPDRLSSSDGRLLVAGQHVPALGDAPVGVLPPAALFGPSGPSASPAPLAQPVDMLIARSLAAAFFATAQGPGKTVSDSTITSMEELGAVWRVTMGGTVTEATGAYYGLTMVLDIDKATGKVTIFGSR